jgi:hypothetical protein
MLSSALLDWVKTNIADPPWVHEAVLLLPGEKSPHRGVRYTPPSTGARERAERAGPLLRVHHPP